MASSSNKIERSLNRIIPKAPTDRILEETIVKIRLKLCELASPDTEPQETGTTDKHPWNDIPRLYTFLRMLSHNHKDVVALIQKERLNDYSLPIDSTALRQLQADVDQEYFEDTQALFLSDDSHMTIEALGGLHNDHRRLEDGTAFFENIKILGQGSSATVYRVRHRVSRSEFACKRIKRASIKQQYNQLEDFLREMRVLKRVDHLHVVKLIASYTDETTFSLVLLPVANDTLDSLLDRISSSPTFPIIPGREASILRRAFGCLLSTIAYLQAKDIRHKDIKPLNILLGDEGRIYLCDFGISLDYSDTKDGTTEGMPIGFTKGYCAPEVPGMESRNSLSEVWSLGRVFFDIMVVLRGRSVQHAKNYIGLDAERMPDLIAKYLAPLVNESNNAFDTLIMQYIIRMTAYDKGQRPAAAELLQEIPFNGIAEDVRQAYLGECCIVDYHKAGYVDNYKLGYVGQEEFAPTPHPVEERQEIPASVSHRSVRYAVIEGSSNDYLRVSPAVAESTALSELEGCSPRCSVSIVTDNSQDDVSVVQSSSTPIAPRAVARSEGIMLQTPFAAEDQRRCSTSISNHSNRRSNSSTGPPSSVPSSPPNGFPIVLRDGCTGCLCVAQTQNGKPTEEQILLVTFASVTASSPSRSSCTDDKCTSVDNTLRIFESSLQSRSGVWVKTRRMIVSHSGVSGESQTCMSFWLPLADVRYVCYSTAVTLRWSDCDQLEEERLGDYNLTYSRTYQPERPNNEITVIFRDETTAQIFLRTVTHAISDASLQWQTVGLPHMQELRAIKAQQSPAHFIVHISAWKGNETASTMFILWQDPIFDLHTHCRPPKTERTLMTRFCGRVSTPRYLSNVTNRPSDDKTVVATCSRADLVFSEYKLELSLGQDIDELGLPLGLKEQLTFLTGWTIRFFASGIKVAGPGRLGKSYGYSDVILWEHDRTATLPVGSVLNSVFASRQTGTKKDYLWRTGTITARSQATYRDPTVEITVFGKSSGDLLDAKDLTTTMEADLQQTGQQSRRRTGKQKEIHQEDGFRLHFDNHNDYRRFFACFDNLRETARADPHMWKFQRNPTVMSHGSQSTASSFRPGPHV